jgi:protein-S-isoprenylcysteine O-methyltransferase Ste14
MELFPPFHPGWLNGWIFLPFVYLMTEGLVKVLPKDIAAKLTDYSGWSKADKALAGLGGIPMLAFFVMLILTPLRVGSPLLAIGVCLFLVGGAIVVDSILRFRTCPDGQPVRGGLYKVSRNPQTVGLCVANLGASLAIGSWVAVAAVLVLQVFLHLRVLAEEKTCLAKYGAAYQEYMNRIPRYFWFF